METTKEVRRDRKKRGQVNAVRGSVIEVEFAADLPAIHEALYLTLEDRSIILEVAHHLDPHRVRAIAMAHTEGLARDMAVERSERPIEMPVGPETLGRLFNVLGEPLDGLPPPLVGQRWPNIETLSFPS